MMNKIFFALILFFFALHKVEAQRDSADHRSSSLSGYSYGIGGGVTNNHRSILSSLNAHLQVFLFRKSWYGTGLAMRYAMGSVSKTYGINLEERNLNMLNVGILQTFHFYSGKKVLIGTDLFTALCFIQITGKPFQSPGDLGLPDNGSLSYSSTKQKFLGIEPNLFVNLRLAKGLYIKLHGGWRQLIGAGSFGTSRDFSGWTAGFSLQAAKFRMSPRY